MNNYDKIMFVSGDVYTVIISMMQKGWLGIKESSINRIIYLASVLFSFMFDDERNPFQEHYNFSITLSGPEDPTISAALTHLQSNEVVNIGDNGYFIANFNYKENFTGYSYYELKRKWIDDISYIIGLYGEGKIYDFVFRDPQYQNGVKTNTLVPLNLQKDNATVKFLNSFKEDFEKQVSINQKLTNRKYLELYFEYVFGKILRGDL